MSNITIGTCGICGGAVTVPAVWGGVNPPTPTCTKCGAVPVDAHGPVIPMRNIEKENKCFRCNGTGQIEYYHDAGDHFGAGTSPWSEWRKEPCPICSKKSKPKISDDVLQVAINYAKSLDW